MSLTMIDLEKSKPIYKDLANELSKIVNTYTAKPGIFEEVEEKHPGNSANEVGFHYTTYTIRFSMEESATLRIAIGGDCTSSLNLEETRHVYTLLSKCALDYLKKKDINVFISLSFYRFSEDKLDLDECFGAFHFADTKSKYTVMPVSDELKALQELIPILSKHFPINPEGTCIQTGKNKFRKMYGVGVVNEDGRAKIGVFHDEVICTIDSKKEVDELVVLKTTKLNELQIVKDEVIHTLRGADPSFAFDGKNGMVLFGEKGTISIEYDVFKKEYLMVFFKSKPKAATIKKLEDKLTKLIHKKLSV